MCFAHWYMVKFSCIIEIQLWPSELCKGFAFHRSQVGRGYGIFSTVLFTDCHHNSIIKISIHFCVWKAREGFLGQVKSNILKCVVVLCIRLWCSTSADSKTVSVYYDRVGCHVLCLQHGIPVWLHIGHSTTAISRHCSDMTSDVKLTLSSTKQRDQLHPFLTLKNW